MVSGKYALHCRGVAKSFGRVKALEGFDVDLPRGQVLALLGPSGCGKTTALRLIAGLDSPDQGTIEIGGRLVAGPGVLVPPEKRGAGMVFQDYALFPHLNVRRNIEYGLPQGVSREARLAELVQLVGLGGLENRMPHELSGGQQQRVALARTLASNPQILLLDEPFSNLDVKLRTEVRAEIRRVIEATGTTAVFVTHDQDEAFVLGDIIIVMNAGRIEQIGTAEELYYRPATRFVAGFVGIANFLSGTVIDGMVHCELGLFSADGGAEGEVDVVVRPDDVVLGEGQAEATIESREFLGHDTQYVLTLGSGAKLRTMQSGDARLRAGDRVHVGLKRDKLATFRRNGPG